MNETSRPKLFRQDLLKGLESPKAEISALHQNSRLALLHKLLVAFQMRNEFRRTQMELKMRKYIMNKTEKITSLL